MNPLSPNSRFFQGQPARAAVLLSMVTALALPAAAFSQEVSGSDDASEALRNIQNNFARMTPPPRTVDSINQELKAGEVKSRPAGMSRRGGGRRGSKALQDGTLSGDKGQAGTDAPAPDPHSAQSGAASEGAMH